MSQTDSSYGRVAGIDYGTVRIGIAVSDPERRLASPYENYNRRSRAKDAERFQRLVQEERITLFVVCLPIHSDGNESVKSLEAREFGHWLQEITGIPVVWFDERFTSVEAEQVLLEAGLTQKKRKERLDKLAACFLLSAYLEAPHAAIDPARNAADAYRTPGSLDH